MKTPSFVRITLRASKLQVRYREHVITNSYGELFQHRLVGFVECFPFPFATAESLLFVCKLLLCRSVHWRGLCFVCLHLAIKRAFLDILRLYLLPWCLAIIFCFQTTSPCKNDVFVIFFCFCGTVIRSSRGGVLDMWGLSSESPGGFGGGVTRAPREEGDAGCAD